MKVIDCFMLYNELDVLKIRLHEVYNFVEYIVIVEATKTHTGNPKPLYYLDNKELFKKYEDKIIHIVTDFAENYDFCKNIQGVNEHWYREKYQREVIQIAIENINLKDEDIVIVTDLDEITNNNIIKDIKEGVMYIQNNTIYPLEMTLYYYNIELTTNRKWYQGFLCNYFTMKQNILLSNMRLGCGVGNYQTIYNGGWQLSYFGDENFIKNKVESFAESIEYTREGKDVNYLKFCLDNNILHFNKEILIHIPIKNNNNVPSFFLHSNNV